MSEPRAGREQAAAAPTGVIAVGASAGGLHALEAVLGVLPDDLGLPVVVAQHLDPRHRSLMAEILGRVTPLHVRQARAGDRLEPGLVLVPVPDRHVLVDRDGAIELSDAAPVRFVRPSIDMLFGSVADHYGEGAVAVVLSGTGSDGAAGVRAVRAAGGTVIVQDPETAEFAAMPRAAIETGSADLVLPLVEIGPALVEVSAAGAGMAPS